MELLHKFLDELSNKKAILVLALLGTAVYFSLLFSGPIIDFPDYVSENPAIQSITNLPGLFTYTLDSPFYQQILRDRMQNYYRPVMLAVISLIYSISGPNTFLFNAVQIALHIFNTFLVFLLFKHFFKNKGAFLLSLVFVVHPLNLETVTFIGIADLLFFSLGLSGLLIAAKENLKKADLFWIFILSSLSLMSKETGIVLIFLTLVYRTLFNRKNLLKLIVIFTLVCVMNLVLRFNFAVVNTRNADFNPIFHSNLSERLMTIPAIISYYLTNFVFPWDLSVFQEWIIKEDSFKDFYLPLTLDLALLAVLIMIGKKIYGYKKDIFRSYIFFSVWFFTGLLPHLQLFPLLMTVADRWFYLPAVGLLGISGLIIQNYFKLRKDIILNAVLIIIVCLALRTFIRTFDWQDNFNLYSADITLHPESYSLTNNLAHEFFIRGQYDRAEDLYQKALITVPGSPVTYNNLGSVYHARKDFIKAEENYFQAISLGNYESAFSNLGILYFEQKEFLKVKETILQGLKSYPNNAIFWRLLALSERELGELDQAIIDAQKSDDLMSDNFSQKILKELKSEKTLKDSKK